MDPYNTFQEFKRRNGLPARWPYEDPAEAQRIHDARVRGMETAKRLIDDLSLRCHEDDCANLARPGLALCEEHDAAMFAPEPLITMDEDRLLRIAAKIQAAAVRERVRQTRAIFGPQGRLTRMNAWIDANPALVMFYVAAGCGFAYSIFAWIHRP